MIWNYRCMVFRNQSVEKNHDVSDDHSPGVTSVSSGARWCHQMEIQCWWFHGFTTLHGFENDVCLKKTIFIGKMRINQGLGLPHFQTKPHWQIKTPNHCLWMFSPRKIATCTICDPCQCKTFCTNARRSQRNKCLRICDCSLFLCCGCLNHWQASTTDRRQLRVSNCNSCHHTSQATQIANKKFTHAETTMRNIGHKLTTKHRRKLTTTTYPNV